MNEYEIIRGDVNEQHKYCRIPIQSRIADTMQEKGIAELNAESILVMPHDEAVKTIDAIISDWQYWLKRAGELFVLYEGCRTEVPFRD